MWQLLLQCSIADPHTETGVAGIILPLVLVSVLLSFYFTAVVFQNRRNKSWPIGRSLSFGSGMLVLAIAFSPSMMEYAHHSFRGHMLQHLFMGMLAPIGLVLGAPVTLVLKTIPRKGAVIITSVLGSRFFHLLSHPVLAMVLNVGGMFVLYLTPLYNATLSRPYMHHLVHLHFLAAGYLFTWSMIGPDPAPRRPLLKLRMAVLFSSIAAHSFLSKMMYAYVLPHNTPFAENDIRSGAKLMYYGGDVTELIIIIILFTTWYRRKHLSKYKLSPLQY